MKKLTIGTKVSYNKVSLKNGETTSLESVVTGYYDGYISLLNGDKMFSQALTEIAKPSEDLQRLHRSYNATNGKGQRACIRKRMVQVIKFENK
jgi:hypothetical protein